MLVRVFSTKIMINFATLKQHYIVHDSSCMGSWIGKHQVGLGSLSGCISGQGMSFMVIDRDSADICTVKGAVC